MDGWMGKMKVAIPPVLFKLQSFQMNSETLKNINKIIERDNKTSTYKFALLRGVIDIIQSNSPYIKIEGNRAILPMGLLIENWILYYYPILANKIPQIYGVNSKLQFEDAFQNIIDHYENQKNGGLSVLYNDLRNKGIQDVKSFTLLAKTLRRTIATMPMKYIGKSIYNEEYAIFKPNNDTLKTSHIYDTHSLIHYAGTFSIPLEYFEAFQLLGSFISGQNTLLFKWAEFSYEASGRSIQKETVFEQMAEYATTNRNTTTPKRIFDDLLEKEKTIYCIWSGKKVSKFDLDHMLPFSVWKNNDLWNLLPADVKMNSQKSDKVPTPELIENRKEIIFDYWDLLKSQEEIRFQKEIEFSLTGAKPNNWKEAAIKQIQNNCEYLIEARGHTPWSPKT